MFQKGSFSIPSDSSGIFLVKVIQTRRCSTLRHAKTGRFLRITIRLTKPELIRRRKKRTRAIVIRTNHKHFRTDGRSFIYPDNALVLLKRRMNTVGKEIFGPTCKELRIKKFLAAFKHIY